MPDYISREAIWPALSAACVPYNRRTQKAIEDIPAANVREVVKLTEAGKRLLKYCPEIINEVAAQLDYRLDSFVLNGDCAEMKGEADGT